MKFKIWFEVLGIDLFKKKNIFVSCFNVKCLNTPSLIDQLYIFKITREHCDRIQGILQLTSFFLFVIDWICFPKRLIDKNCSRKRQKDRKRRKAIDVANFWDFNDLFIISKFNNEYMQVIENTSVNIYTSVGNLCVSK